MTRYEPMGTSSAVANALHSGGKRHNKIEPASIEQPPTAELFSKEQATDIARRLVEGLEKLDNDDVAGTISRILWTSKPAKPDVRILLTPEMSEDDPAYTTAEADFTTKNSACLGGCGLRAGLDSRFEGHCCGKCWQHTNDPNAGKKRKHCRRCRREWYYANAEIEQDADDHEEQEESDSPDENPDTPELDPTTIHPNVWAALDALWEETAGDSNSDAPSLALLPTEDSSDAHEGWSSYTRIPPELWDYDTSSNTEGGITLSTESSDS